MTRSMRRLAFALAAAVLALTPAQAAAPAAPITPAEHLRGEEQTYLTYPEWYLVHSPAELADYLQAGRGPSRFPWWGHVGQFWQGYQEVTRRTADHPFNAGYHLMVSVIGSSTTVEYGLRAAYEGTIGRLAEASAGGHLDTAEDRLAADVARRYVEFIRVDPWYLFDFGGALRSLWRDTPPTGAHMLRKWERRLALSTEYLAKAGYAWLIKLATRSIYDEARPTTAVVLDRVPASWPQGASRIDVAAGGVVALLPRYQAFLGAAQALSVQGVGFVEIAGNRGPILASVLIDSRDAAAAVQVGQLLFRQPVLSLPGRERLVLTVPVAGLAAALRRWQDLGVKVEHLYDY